MGLRTMLGLKKPGNAPLRPDAAPKFNAVTEQFGEVKYMRPRQADFARRLILEHNLTSLLELGFYQGKSTAYLAAILEDRGGPGQITTIDRRKATLPTPYIHDILGALALSHRATVIVEERSFTMALLAMLEANPRPQFDLCYFDGAHNWDGTGFAFLLVDKLLRPGGWAVFDDLDWTMDNSPAGEQAYAQHPERERKMKQVRKVWEILVPDAGYVNCSETPFGWGVAQKPMRP